MKPINWWVVYGGVTLVILLLGISVWVLEGFGFQIPAPIRQAVRVLVFGYLFWLAERLCRILWNIFHDRAMFDGMSGGDPTNAGPGRRPR